jgi:hypothetical protein
MPDPGSVLTTTAKAAAAASRIRPWATVKRHDRLVLEEYEDLITWARDDLQKEAEALNAVKEDLNSRNLLYSGEYGSQLRRVRDEFARRWRDRKRAADRKLAELQEAEGVTVRAWRRLRGKPWPTNPDEGQLRAITAAWEDEERRAEAVRSEVEGLQRGFA